MPLISSFLRALLVLFLTLSLLPLAAAQIVSARGTGTVENGFFTPNATVRENAVQRALVNALENHVAEQGKAKQSLFERHRAEITANIGRYVLQYVKLSEHEDSTAKTYTINIRAEIDATRLQAKLDEGAAVAVTPAEARSILTFVFYARAQDSVQEFDDKVHKRADLDTRYGQDTQESESMGRHSIGTRDRKETSVSVATTTGGSRIRKSDRISWKISSVAEINTEMTGIFSAANYEVVDAEYVDGIPLDRIRKDFSTGNDLSAPVLRNAASAVRMADIPYLVYGTLDVGMNDRDPVSGLVRVYVTVTGKVLDVRGRFPKTVSSVGPVQYAGLGPDGSVARVNALKEAATRAAVQIANELNLKAVR
ncbi:MAG: hypothetical protein LBR88_09615 [Zoogloeaceae bacterium]|jgi:hypothetical protein|nr:hypothetical protein [Zoogloeaceae bacterium]